MPPRRAERKSAAAEGKCCSSGSFVTDSRALANSRICPRCLPQALTKAVEEAPQQHSQVSLRLVLTGRLPILAIVPKPHV